MLRSQLPPGEVHCPSLTALYRGANWMERECYDLFGVVFDGHPDLRRILLGDDWEGHPFARTTPSTCRSPPIADVARRAGARSRPMIYELRTYTLAPGMQGQYLKLNAEVGRTIRGDKYGVLEGAWTTEFATLNQYVHLWGYPDLNERDRLRGEFAKNEEWSQGLRLADPPLMLAQENKILSAVLPPAAAGRRRARLRAALVPHADGQGRGVARPLQGHPCPCARNTRAASGLWQTEMGQLNEVVHLWAYAI